MQKVKAKLKSGLCTSEAERYSTPVILPGIQLAAVYWALIESHLKYGNII